MKNNLSSIIIGLSVIITAMVLGNAFQNRNKSANTIAVTGLGTKDFVSDLIVWSGNFSKRNMILKDAYAELDRDRETIRKYLNSKGISDANIVFSAVGINKEFQTIYDSRDNITNPSKGMFMEFDYKFNSKINDNMTDYSSVYFDLRNYKSFSKTKHRVWANKLFWWNTFGGNAHYLDLPSIGWDHYQKTGRGFTRNRFRSNALIYLESEYRTDITKDGLLGAVFFALLTISLS